MQPRRSAACAGLVQRLTDGVPRDRTDLCLIRLERTASVAQGRKPGPCRDARLALRGAVDPVWLQIRRIVSRIDHESLVMEAPARMFAPAHRPPFR